MKKRIILLFTAVLILSACGNEEEDVAKEAEPDSEELVVDEKEETDEEDEVEDVITLSDIEVTNIDDLEHDELVRFNQDDFLAENTPTDGVVKVFYGDNEVIASTHNRETIKYDLGKDEIIWEYPEVPAVQYMNDGILYFSSFDDKKPNVNVVSTETGEVVKNYTNKDFKFAEHINVFDDLLVFNAHLVDKTDNHKKSMLVFDLESAEFLWSTPVESVHDDPVNLEDSILLYNEYLEDEDEYMMEKTAFVYDKKTGEALFKIEEDTIRNQPAINGEGMYFVDYGESTIRLYDFDGNLQIEEEMEIGFGVHQLIHPVATDDSYIAVNDEGIAWYETDLSGIQHQVDRGESAVRWMASTEDRLYAVTSEDTEDDMKMYYLVSIDLDTGEVYSKVEITETDENKVSMQHVTNGKFHFAFGNKEKEVWEHFVISSENVNKAFDE